MNVKLSVIMPCYNVEDTLGRALDSVLMQDVDFEFEIIIVDDASTDMTATIVHNYMLNHSFIKYLKNPENSGNAHSFYRGLCESRGDYFCVLDGDDYYTVQDKLKKQVRFLDRDTEKRYVATATHFLIDFGDGTIHVPDRSNIKEFTYADLLCGKHGYFHTATYLYRNIFKGNVPEYFDMKLYRGDTPRTIFHLMYSGKKVRVLDFVGSAYSYTFKGIWSSENEQEHFRYQIHFYEEHRKYLGTDFERRFADRQIESNRKKLERTSNQLHHYPQIDIETCLSEVKWFANKFSFAEKEYMLREIYSSEYIDTLVASLGVVLRMHSPECIQTATNNDSLCIFVSVLKPQGGGIFAEIKELAKMYADKNVFIFQTDAGGFSEEAIEAMSDLSNVSLETYPENEQAPLAWMSKKMAQIAPYRAYYYCSHADVLSQAVMASGACENIALFSFDHGYVVGLHNPNLTSIVAKRPVDYKLLSHDYAHKLLYIPAWSNGHKLDDESKYEPLRAHDHIVTASGAARFYKIDGAAPYRYIDIIPQLLAETDGLHYHFGPISDSAKSQIIQALNTRNLPIERFVHVEWSSDIVGDLQKYGVDLFIEPFPTVSYKLTLEVLSAGIPVAAWQALKRMQITDFVPSDSIYWKNVDELICQVRSLTKEKLTELSNSAKAYYKHYHAFNVVRSHIRECRSMIPQSSPFFADDTINEMSDYLVICKLDRISIMKRYLERTKHAPKQQTTNNVKGNRNSSPANHLPDSAEVINRCRWMKESHSFVIGYAISSRARRLRCILKRKAICEEAVDKMATLSPEEFVNFYGAAEANRQIDRIRMSTTYQIGRAATLPARKIKRHLR